MPKTTSIGKSITVSGGSISAEHTGFIVSELDIQLDAGYDFKRYVQDIFVTHSHIDHTGALSQILIINPGMKINIYVPEEIATSCAHWIKTSLDFSKSNVRAEGYSYYNIVPVKIGTTFEIITFNKKVLQIEIFKCFHTVPCVGYGFSEKRKRLKEDYKPLNGQEIGALKKAGVEITEDVFVPELLFMGDTTQDVFKDKNVFNYPIIMIECTYYDDADLKLAKSNSHMHWKFLEPVIAGHPENKFVIMHPSAKIKMSTIKKKFKADNLLFL